MNSYEHTMITRQDLSETQAKELLSKYEALIKTNSGEIIKIEEWGLRNFARNIKNNKKGFYVHIKFEGSGNAIGELEKLGNIDEFLIRFLTIRVKKHDLETNYFEKKEY